MVEDYHRQPTVSRLPIMGLAAPWLRPTWVTNHLPFLVSQGIDLERTTPCRKAEMASKGVNSPISIVTPMAPGAWPNSVVTPVDLIGLGVSNAWIDQTHDRTAKSRTFNTK
jgi:hypothetical protein